MEPAIFCRRKKGLAERLARADELLLACLVALRRRMGS
jgi:hypothetical protein